MSTTIEESFYATIPAYARHTGNIMKTIAVILPINNPDILTESDLAPYQSDECQFNLYYTDTDLKEITNREEAAALRPLVVQKAKQVAHEKDIAAIIIYAFGDSIAQEVEQAVNVPVMALGPRALHEANELSKNHFTVLPALLTDNSFIGAIAQREGLTKYTPAKNAVEIKPAVIRKTTGLLAKLIELASKEHTENGIDTFTLGCGSFIGMAKPLEEALQAKFGSSIRVVDPVKTTFEHACELCPTNTIRLH